MLALLARGAAPAGVDGRGRTPLEIVLSHAIDAAALAARGGFARRLRRAHVGGGTVRASASATARDAAYTSAVSCAEALLAACGGGVGVGVSGRSWDEVEGLVWGDVWHVAFLGDAALMGVLLRRGRPAFARDAFGRTPLHYACLSDAPAIVRLLLLESQQAGISGEALGTPDGRGDTPLHLAAGAGACAAIEELAVLSPSTSTAAAFNASCVARNVGGRTPLHEAALRGRRGAVRLLMERLLLLAGDGNDAAVAATSAEALTAPDCCGVTALGAAVEAGCFYDVAALMGVYARAAAAAAPVPSGALLRTAVRRGDADVLSMALHATWLAPPDTAEMVDLLLLSLRTGGGTMFPYLADAAAAAAAGEGALSDARVLAAAVLADCVPALDELVRRVPGMDVCKQRLSEAELAAATGAGGVGAAGRLLLLGRPLTPLAAACMCGAVGVVAWLADRGARDFGGQCAASAFAFALESCGLLHGDSASEGPADDDAGAAAAALLVSRPLAALPPARRADTPRWGAAAGGGDDDDASSHRRGAVRCRLSSAVWAALVARGHFTFTRDECTALAHMIPAGDGRRGALGSLLTPELAEQQLMVGPNPRAAFLRDAAALAAACPCRMGRPLFSDAAAVSAERVLERAIAAAAACAGGGDAEQPGPDVLVLLREAAVVSACGLLPRALDAALCAAAAAAAAAAPGGDTEAGAHTRHTAALLSRAALLAGSGVLGSEVVRCVERSFEAAFPGCVLGATLPSPGPVGAADDEDVEEVRVRELLLRCVRRVT